MIMECTYNCIVYSSAKIYVHVHVCPQKCTIHDLLCYMLTHVLNTFYFICRPTIEGGISHSTELQMHYASFISNIIKGFPDDRRYKLFSCAKRKSLFFALSKWNGSFWQEDGHEQRYGHCTYY